jgi:hypothetical protein
MTAMYVTAQVRVYERGQPAKFVMGGAVDTCIAISAGEVDMYRKKK